MNTPNDGVYEWALCVGGPFAGRHMRVRPGQQWIRFPSAQRPLYMADFDPASCSDLIADQVHIHDYHARLIGLGHGSVQLTGLVYLHRSMHTEDAKRAMMAMLIADLAVKGMNTDPTTPPGGKP